MTDFSQVLIASDYDRTMTAFSGEIPRSNVDAVAEFIALGGAFTIATGRSYPMFVPHLAKMRVNAPVILANGGAIWTPETDEIEVRCPMPEGWLNVIREIHERYPGLHLEMQGIKRHSCRVRDPLREAYMDKNGVPYCYCGWDEVDDTVLSVSFYAPFQSVGHARAGESDPEDERPFVEIFDLVERCYGDRFIAIRSMPRMIEILPRDCGKGTAARWLMKRLGRSVLYCVGDAPNDMHMLLEADEAFIPSTADPAILGYGFTEVASCEEGTVASVIELLKRR